MQNPLPPGGQDDPTDDPLPVLPPLTDRLYVVHYTTARGYERGAVIPPVLGVILRNVLTGQEHVFETFTAFECDQLSRADLDTHYPRYERDALSACWEFVTGTPGAVWVYWRGRDIYSGLAALSRRAKTCHLHPAVVPLDQTFDLSYYFKRRYDLHPTTHPPLVPTLVEAFGPNSDLLDAAGLQAAWEAAEYVAILRSLAAEACGVADLYFRARQEPRTPAAALTNIRRLSGVPAPPTLTGREEAILDELLEKGAFDRRTRVSTLNVAVGCDGDTAVPASFKRPITQLKGFGLVQTVTGCHGGVWLTAAGAERARANRHG